MNSLRTLLAFLCLSLFSCTHVSNSSRVAPKAAQARILKSEPAAEKKATTPAAKPAPIAPVMTDTEFSACINTLLKKGKIAGISSITLANGLIKAKLNTRVLELDRKQPEFTTTFADYFNRRVTDKRVEQGKALLTAHRLLLNRIEQQYGVPAPYLLAFWGLETNYGSFVGDIPVVDSLATLACDKRRSDYFTGELISALRILDEGAVTSEKMIGSWAGAMGHVQFMPSAYLKYAVDYDGDKKRDLWNSTPDAIASAANFLKGLGWQAGGSWGREVKLPANFPFIEVGLQNSKSLSEWQALGVKAADNMPLPQGDAKASLLVPSGYQGPAFLVYENYNVIMRWNRSEFYAIAVGQLADRIAGGGKLVQPPPEDAPRLYREQVIAIQEKLNKKGFPVGTPDGIFGPGTRRALSEFQHKYGMVADGFPDKKVLGLLGVNVEPEKN